MKIKRIIAAIMTVATMTAGLGSIASAEALFYATKWYDNTNSSYYIQTKTTTTAYFYYVYTTAGIYATGNASYNWNVQANDSFGTTYPLWFTMTSGNQKGAGYGITHNRPNGYLQFSRKYYR